MSPRDLREYGLGSVGKPIGKPKASPLDAETKASLVKSGGCPGCGCEDVMQIKLKVLHPLVGEGTCSYLGCPACPWASPALVVRSGT